MKDNKNLETAKQLDWKLPNRTLSRQTGLPKRTISYYRQRLGAGRATAYAPQDTPTRRKMNIRPDEIDWSKPRRQIAEETGVSVQRIGQIWRILQTNAPDETPRGTSHE